MTDPQHEVAMREKMDQAKSGVESAIIAEPELTAILYQIIRAGAAARRDQSPCPYPASERLKSMLHSLGWVREDLRLALMKHNPSYRADQVAFDMAEAMKER